MMGSIFSPEALARMATRHPRTVVGVWAVILVLAVVAASGLGDVLSTDQETYEQFEAARAEELIEANLNGTHPVQEFVIVQAESAKVDDPLFRRVALDLAERLAGDPEYVKGVVNYYATGDDSLISADRGTLLMPVALAVDVGDAEETQEAGEHVLGLVREAAAEAPDGFVLVTGGEGSIATTFNEITERDLQKAELIGLPIALVVLVVVFGALVAAGMPVVLGLLGIVVALGITALIGRAYELSFFVTNMIFMIGLAVGIDYTLLVIQRFREERRRGLTRDSAIIKAGGTASRAVLFSGIAVIVSLAGLLIVPDSIFRSLSIGAIVVVAVAISASLTLLPALLRLLGDRVNTGRVRMPGRGQTEESGRFWNWAVRGVMRRPAIMLVAAVALLLAAAAPYLRVELGFSGVETLPSDTEPGQAFAILGEEFSQGLLAPFQIVIEGRPGDEAVESRIERLTALLEADGAFGEVVRTDAPAGQLIVLETAVNADSQSDVALDALGRVRGEYIPQAFGTSAGSASVTGDTAYIHDYANMINKWTPVVFAFVLGLSFIILLVVFRSIVVPVKAIIMNLLSVGAAYGIVVLVIQEGVGADLFGFTQVERIESWVPLFMFAILFGLSMDYHVFLLTRIRERFDQTDNNIESVAYGVRATAGLITGAAAIMVAVFAGFAAGDMSMMQQFGFGLAVAITLDATVVRIILVPAAMAMLGRANWYLPSWLEWLPRVDVDGVRDSHGPEPVPVHLPLPQGDPAA